MIIWQGAPLRHLARIGKESACGASGITVLSWGNVTCPACKELLVSCDACNAEPGEPCRPGCLGYAIEHDGLVGTEPCS